MQKLPHKLMSITLLLTVWLATGEEATAGSSDSDLRQPVVLKVPRSIRKYKLRIGGKEYTPRDETLLVTPYGSGKKMYVELLDGDHRTVFGGFRKYSQDALTDIAKRSFSVALNVGGSVMTAEDSSGLFVGKNMSYLSLSAQWQPSLLGLSLSSHQFRSYDCWGNSPCGRFDMAANGAALVTEIAPFTRGTPFWQRLHLALHLGLSSVRTKFDLSEKDISLHDKDVSLGKFGNFEFRIPIARVWIDIQHGRHEIPVELKTLDYRRTIKQETFAMGGRYAF